jgi:hypothetical protein
MPETDADSRRCLYHAGGMDEKPIIGTGLVTGGGQFSSASRQLNVSRIVSSGEHVFRAQVAAPGPRKATPVLLLLIVAAVAALAPVYLLRLVRQERLGAYFRLEWKLAIDLSHRTAAERRTRVR